MDREAAELIFYSALLLLLVCGWTWRSIRLRSTKTWAETQGTVESGAFENVQGGRYLKAVLPVFAFSYVVKGEHYSGRFSLLPYSNDLGDSIIKLIVGNKVPVRYNPVRPDQWFVDQRFMQGYKVEQKIGPPFDRLYPKD